MLIFALIIFILSFLAIASIFFVKLSQVSQRPSLKIRVSAAPTHQISLRLYFREKLGVYANKLWHFILEAKDLKPATTKNIHTQVEKVKNVFRIRIRSSENE